LNNFKLFENEAITNYAKKMLLFLEGVFAWLDPGGSENHADAFILDTM